MNKPVGVNVPPYASGLRFGSVVVIDYRLVSSKAGRRYRLYRCICDCGRETSKAHGDLTRWGRYGSCSCGCVSVKKAIDRWRKYPGNPSLNLTTCSYRRSANRRGYEWSLSHEQAAAMFSADCYYCGSKPSREVSIRGGGHKTLVNGIDRKDSRLGYTEGNCVPCCSTCNFAKSDKSMEEWESWLESLVQFRQRK